MALTAFGLHLNFASLTVPTDVVLLGIIRNRPHSKFPYVSQIAYFGNVRRRYQFYNKTEGVGVIPIYKRLLQFIKRAKLDKLLSVKYEETEQVIYIENKGKNDYFYLYIHKQLVQLLSLEKIDIYDQFFIRDHHYLVIYLPKSGIIKSQHVPLYSSKLHPSLINIECNLVAAYQANEKYCNTIHTASIPWKKISQYYYHIVKEPTYLDLSGDAFNDISIRFLNEKSVSLPLLEGSSSIVKLNIRKKSEKMVTRVNVKISSEKTRLHPDNTASKFTSRLHSPLEVGDKATVYLSSISYPNNISNIPQKIANKEFIIETNLPGHENDLNQHLHIVTHKFKVIAGQYRTPDQFLEMVNKVNPAKSVMKFKYEDHFCVIEVYDPCIIKIPIEFHRIFGFPNKNTEDGYYTIKVRRTPNEYLMLQPMLFNDYFPNFMLCYCNIIEPTMIGSIYANILKLIPTKLSEDRYTTIEFESPDKLHLNCHLIDDIHFELRSHDGDLINFIEDKEVIMHLIVVDG